MKRQGELLIIKVHEVKDKERMNKAKHRILAEGEATGHMHELSIGTLYKPSTWSMDTDQYFEVPENSVSVLSHPEHKELTFDTGIYRVITQREYEEAGVRKVTD